MTEHLESTWNMIMQDKNHHIIVKEIDGKIKGKSTKELKQFRKQVSPNRNIY